MTVTDTIKQVVYHELPFLANTAENDAYIDDETAIALIELQNLWVPAKSDAEYADEANFSAKERLLAGYYVAYYLIEKRILENMGGIGNDDTGETEATEDPLKKVKVDVIEIEFGTKTKANSLVLDAETMLINYAKKLCNLARQLKMTLPVCGQFKTKPAVGAKFYKWSKC